MTSAARDLRKFTASEYLRMLDAEIFGEDDRVELVGGEVLNVSPQGPEHRSLKDELRERLREAYADAPVYLQDQGPLRSGPRGVPEPDLAVVRGAPRDYLEEHPSGGDTVLVVEIAKTTQERDRAKAADYASGGVPVYWLLDLQQRTLDVYTQPDPSASLYRAVVSLTETEEVDLPELATTWAVASLLA